MPSIAIAATIAEPISGEQCVLLLLLLLLLLRGSSDALWFEDAVAAAERPESTVAGCAAASLRNEWRFGG